MTKWFLLKTDQKKVSCMHPWTETFQPYEHVKRKIYKVSRKANRNPRVGYQISNGPGPRPWTRPAPYFRRTITSFHFSYPRTSIFHGQRLSNGKVHDSALAFHDENQDDDSSIPPYF